MLFDMNSLNLNSNLQSKSGLVRRRLITVLLALLALPLVAFALVSPVRRVVLNPLILNYTTPQQNVTTVAVRADALQNHVFDPAVIEIKAGTTITWSFQDMGEAGAHNVVSINIARQSFASPVLTTGLYTHTFTQPGTYLYDCTLHSNMRGKVIVTP